MTRQFLRKNVVVSSSIIIYIFVKFKGCSNLGYEDMKYDQTLFYPCFITDDVSSSRILKSFSARTKFQCAQFRTVNKSSLFYVTGFFFFIERVLNP